MKLNEWFVKNEAQESERELDKEHKVQDAEKTLSGIELNAEIINSLSPEEMHKLNERLIYLHRDIGQAEHVYPEEFPELKDEEIIPYISSLPGRAKEFVIRLIGNDLEEKILAEKFLEYDKAHWQEVFQEKQNGVTPFGDLTEAVKNNYLARGIDLEHPTQGDVNAFFQGLHYNGGAIFKELNRRVKIEFGDIDKDTQEVLRTLLHRFVRINETPGKLGENDESRKKKYEEMKMLLSK